METPDTIINQGKKREQTKLALGTQRNARRAKAANRGIHAVSHTITKSRVQDAEPRVTLVRPKEKRWQPASSLPGMPELPGYSLKWARIHNRMTNGVGDGMNLSRHLQQGWEVAKASDFPHSELPTTSIARHGEVIGNDNTILLKIETALVEQRNAYYNRRRDTAADAINGEFVKTFNDPRMPLVENVVQTDVGFSRRRRRPRREAQEATE